MRSFKVGDLVEYRYRGVKSVKGVVVDINTSHRDFNGKDYLKLEVLDADVKVFWYPGDCCKKVKQKIMEAAGV